MCQHVEEGGYKKKQTLQVTSSVIKIKTEFMSLKKRQRKKKKGKEQKKKRVKKKRR